MVRRQHSWSMMGKNSLCTGYSWMTWSKFQQPNIFSMSFLHSLDFEITGGHHLMKSFIGLDVEKSRRKISLHLDAYIQETLAIYKAHPCQWTKVIRTRLHRCSRVTFYTSGCTRNAMMPDKKRQAFSWSMVAQLQFADVGEIIHDWTIGAFQVLCISGIIAFRSTSSSYGVSREAPELQAVKPQRPDEDHRDRSRWFLLCGLGNERQPSIDHW